VIRRQHAATTRRLACARIAALAVAFTFAGVFAGARLGAASLNVSSLLPTAGSALASQASQNARTLPAQSAQPEFAAARVITDRATGDIVATGNARFTQGATLLTADEIRFNPKSQTATARGHVELTSGPARLHADEILYNLKSQTATARNHVEVTRGPARLLADEFVYHAADGTFTLTAPRLGEYPYYISGRQASGGFAMMADSGLRTPDSGSGSKDAGRRTVETGAAATATTTTTNITLTDAIVTLQEPGEPLAPTLRADTLTYTRDSRDSATDSRDSVPAANADASPTTTTANAATAAGSTAAARIRTSNTRLGLGPLSLLKLPRLSQTVDGSILAYFTARVGYSGNLGEFLDVGALFPVADGVRVGADAGFYLKRGLLVGPAAAYDITTAGGSRVTGSLTTGYIHDYGDRLTDILGRPIDIDRGFVTWKHDQTITPNLRLFAQANYWSDSEVIRDFRPGQFYSVQQPDNFLEADYTQPNYIISLFARAQLNPYYPVQQRLPELRFDLLPSPIGVQGIYQKGSLSAAALDSGLQTPDSGFGTPDSTVTSNRLDAYYALYRPIAFNKNDENIATLTPIVGARATYYADATGGKNNYTRYLGEIGFDAEAHLAGTFAYKNEKWGIDGLRHLMTPRLSYRYIPQADKGTPYIPPIDEQTFTTYLQPLGLGDLRNIDQISPTNTFRIGLDNTLQTRDATYGSRDLVTLNLAADYRLAGAIPAADAIDTTTPPRAFSAVHTTLALMPARWLTLGLYDSIIPQNLTLRELNTGLQIHDGQLWALSLSTHYLRSQINEYIAEGRYRLNEAYEVYARLHYDNREHRFNERSFGVIQKLGHNLWTIRYAVTLYQGQTRESSFGFSADVRLMNF